MWLNGTNGTLLVSVIIYTTVYDEAYGFGFVVRQITRVQGKRYMVYSSVT